MLVVAGVDHCGQPHREHRGRLGLDGEVGDDVLHQRLVREHATARVTARRDTCQAASATALRIRAAEPSTQSSRVAATI